MRASKCGVYADAGTRNETVARVRFERSSWAGVGFFQNSGSNVRDCDFSTLPASAVNISLGHIPGYNRGHRLKTDDETHASTSESSNSTLFRIEPPGEKVSGWSFVSPDGSPWLYKAVSLVDMTQYGSIGDFVPYDCVLLQVHGKVYNVTAAAENSYRNDVVAAPEGYSLKAIGDTLLVGGSQPPLTSYFWLEQLGTGGAIEWSYSTTGGSWAPVNGGYGLPYSATNLGPGGRFDLDRGGDYGPGTTGMDTSDCPNANRATWWKSAGASGGAPTPLPSDLAATTVPGGGSTPLFWLRGQVTKPYITPPVINQVYDRPDLGEMLSRKYSGKKQWAEATAARLRGWGFTSTGVSPCISCPCTTCIKRCCGCSNILMRTGMKQQTSIHQRDCRQFGVGSCPGGLNGTKRPATLAQGR